MSEDPNKTVREEGWQAYRCGTRLKDNPYAWASTSSRNMWREGWLDAERCARDAMYKHIENGGSVDDRLELLWSSAP